MGDITVAFDGPPCSDNQASVYSCVYGLIDEGSLQVGYSVDLNHPPFVWPETGEDARDGLVLYGAMFNPFSGPWAVISAVAAEPFGYDP